MLACVQFLKEHIPGIRIKFVNVNELNVLGQEGKYANALSDETFNSIFTEDKHVLFSFHGYPDAIKQLLFDREGGKRFHPYGYTERGTTTTPFDMLVRNGISRYHFAIRAIEHAAPLNGKVADKASRVIALCKKKLAEHREYILKNGHDPEDINAWQWR
jgi:xylulose-5-phosphate/fructose-6-phosphate phosphoketolase